MSSISIDMLDIGKDEMLTVMFHKRTGEWWAVVDKTSGKSKPRAVGQGDSPIAAMAELLIDLGERPVMS